ncbi:MAG: response regulator [Anaerolineae bacterium]|nr:response regulator [Anaerolineae bacterium]
MTMADLKGKRIFLIEDNVGNRAIMQTMLEQFGTKIGFERWGTDTIKKLDQFSPVDIILLDLMFPRGVTGYDIFDEIRSHIKYGDVPIVAVSASEPAIAIPKTRAKGFAGFISKPIDFDLFPSQVLAILKREPVWDAG